MLIDFTLAKLERLYDEEPDDLRAMWYATIANLYEEGSVTILWEGGQPVPISTYPSEPADIIKENKHT
tara:strand:+ start:240 stop:443 length:204 start_codon:yes stop_codon:yes gene_type:complete